MWYARSRAEQSRAEQSRAEQSRAEQSRAEPSSALFNRLARFTHLGYYPYLYERIFEKLHGVDFHRDSSEGIDASKGYCHYNATSIAARGALKKYFKKLNITTKDAIIDVGCGKGRMVYFFSKIPFGRISGLEYSRAIAAIAEANMQRLFKSPSEREKISIIQGCATSYTDYDKYNYFFLYNPFNEIIMTPFLENLKASIARFPREIKIIYYNPVYHDLLVNSGFKLERELSLRKKFLSPSDNKNLRMMIYKFGENK